MNKLDTNYNCLGKYKMPNFKNSENLIAVDIGCNAGNFIKKYQHIFSKIHFYEINDYLFNYVSNKYKSDKIIGFNEAVSNIKDKKLEIIRHRSNDAGSTAIKNDNIVINEWTGIIQKINSVDLETVIGRVGHIDYLKMDCETSEFDILMNKDLSKIEFLAIEVHWQLGTDNWGKLIKHILKYFNKYQDGNLGWTAGKNKELHFISKTSKNI